MTDKTRKALDAIELLMQDHREVESLFTEFVYLLESRADTSDVITLACAELRMHDALENEVFYPALSSAAGEDEIEALLDDAEQAHDDVLDLIDDLDAMDSDAAREAHFKLIVAQVTQHIAQEEGELFPRATRLARLDLDAVAELMKARRNELMGGTELAETTTVESV